MLRRASTLSLVALSWLASPAAAQDAGTRDAGTSADGAMVAPATRDPKPNLQDAGAPSPGEEPAILEARRLSDLARQAYDLGSFEQALSSYAEAYQHKPLPGFLFNIAQCHRQLGAWASASFFFGRFLDLQPDAANAELARSLKAEAEARQLSEEADARRRVELALEQGRLEAARAEAEAARARAGALELERARTPALLTRWWFVAAVGTVAVGSMAAWIALHPEPSDLPR